MNNPDSNKYISLKAAAGMYGYTRDHLGLMIRRGKLKGIKLGSYYVTTGEWMAGYVKNFAALDHPTLKNKLSNKLLAGIFSSRNDSQVKMIVKEKIQKYDTDNSLKEIIMEELTKYANAPDADALPEIKSANAPYVILPMRKMKNAEREEVFRKAS